MRLGTLPISIALLIGAVVTVYVVETAWAGYVAISLALLAGLVHDRFKRIYRGDQRALASLRQRSLPASARDYLALRQMAQRLISRAGRTAIASAEVSHHADRLDQRLEEQERIVRDAVSSMGAITVAIEQVTNSASQVAELASRSREANQSSREALDRVITEMSALAERSGEALTLLETLSTKSHSVRNVTGLIEEIAEQTNLLSLNASIEAARAGEHGRGFAVVAGEVRGLAKRTADATHQVEALVDEIGNSSQKVVETIGHLMRRVGDRAREVESVGGHLSTMTSDFDIVETEIAAIAGSMSETRGHSRQVAQTLEMLETQVDEGNRDMHDLADQARALMEAAEAVDGELAQQRLDGRHQAVYFQARRAAEQIGALFDNALKQGELSERDLFSEEYEPVAGTQPPKYRTPYDEFTDKNLPAIQEPLMKSLGAAYAITCDRRGYVPTHNLHVSQPPSGDYETDLKFSRSKRIFDDPTGRRCGSHTQPLLVQTYKRDTGEVMHDLSVPIHIAGRHWGGLRIGYLPKLDAAL